MNSLAVFAKFSDALNSPLYTRSEQLGPGPKRAFDQSPLGTCRSQGLVPQSIPLQIFFPEANVTAKTEEP